MQHNSPQLKRRYNWHIIAMLLFVLVPFAYAADSAPKALNVLILSPSSNPWNEQTTVGLLTHFGKEGQRIVVHRETVSPLGKRGVTQISVEQLNARYANANIDYVIATDPTQGMLPYLKKAGNTLLPNAIKIYETKSGRTFKATQSIDVPNTLIVERPSLIDQALDQALQLHQPKQLYLFTNPQGNGYHDKTLVAAVEALKQQGTLTAKVNYMPLMSTQGYIDYLRAQPAQDGMVFFTVKFKDANGPVVPAAMINTIAAAIDMPVVPYFGSMMNGKGVFGGLLQQPFMYGELLVDVVLEHQQGRLFDYQTYRANESEEERANYPVIPIHENVFDDKQLHRLGIAHRDLPKGSRVIDQAHWSFAPGDYLAEMVFAFAILLAGWVVLLAWMVRHRTQKLKGAEVKLSLANQQLSSDLFKSQQRALHIQTNLELTGIGFIILSLETGQILDANQEWADVLGYTLDELKQLNLLDIDPSIPRDKLEKVLKGIQRDGKRHLQSRQCTKDGRLVDVDISLVAAEATNDLPAHIVSFVIDISAEKAQSARLQQMYSAMATTRTGYVVLSVDGVKVLDVNSAMADLWGLSREEALKLEMKDIEAIKTPDEVQQAALAVKQAGMLTFTSMHKRKFGEPIDVEVTAIYQPENTEFVESVVCFVRDISVTRKAQKEAQKQQAYFSSVFDSLGASGMGVWMLSYDTKRLVDCTDTFAEGLGYTREEVLKAPVENILTLFSPSVIERAEELSHKRKDLTYPYFEMRTKQGEKQIHRVATYAWSDSPWGKNVLVGISSDVTEQARMTQETKERGQQLEAIFDTAPFSIFIASRDGRMRWCNDNACELFGLSDKQLTATTLNALMEPTSYQQFEQDLKQALKVNELLDIDVRVKHQAKGIVPVRVMGRSVMHDGEQAVIYFAVDQSERVAKENELRRSNEEKLLQARRFREYLDASPVALSLVEGDDAGKRKVTYVNRAWENLLGYSLEEMQGESTKHLYLDEESFNLASSTLNNAIDADKAWDFETQQKRKDGSVFTARIQGCYLVADDKIRGINFVQDLTAQQAYEKELISARDQAEAAARAKSSFLANMSHEIRTPMNAILSMSELLLEIISDDQEREMARLIDKGAKDLLAILNQVLDLSRIDSGSYELRLEASNMSLLIEDATKLYEAQAYKKDLEYVVDAAIDTAPRLADPQLIRQVLSNLISNAIKFTEEGTILVRAKLVPSNDTTDLLEIDVIDTGVGMSEEQQKVVFERFEQADASTTRKFGGTGLGLTITRELVLLMGGDISLISSLGEGSRFHVSLPLRHVIEEGATVHQLPQLDSLKGNVLVVDDIESNRMALSRLLESMSMRATSVSSASSAITSLAKQPVDVVITDLHMPNASGLELLEMIRRGIHPMIDKQLPVVFLTADVMSEEKDKAEAMDISGWLHKPVSKAEVSRVLSAILGGKDLVDPEPIAVKDGSSDKTALVAWNRAEMAERMVDDDVLLNNICSLFLDNLPQLQSNIQVAYSSRDAEEGAVQAHTLKGSAANSSAEQLHAVAKSLESAFRAANWERVERYVKELPEAIKATEEAMRAHQQRSQS